MADETTPARRRPSTSSTFDRVESSRPRRAPLGGMQRPEPSASFDRVRRPDASVPKVRDPRGKEAMFSVAPEAPPSTLGLVICEKCDIESGIGIGETIKILLPPPVIYNPITRKLWGHCPACRRRSWLRIRQGQVLRALLDRNPVKRLAS